MSADARGFVWTHSPYKGSTLLVHLAIGDVVNDMHGNEFWATVAKIMAKTRLGRSAVSAALSRMVEDEFLEILTEGGGRGKATRYRFLTPETAQIVGGLADPKPRDPSRQTARSTTETARSMETSPYTNQREPKENQTSPNGEPPEPLAPSVKERARDLTRRVWEARNPKPAQPFIAVCKIAERMLDAGHDDEALYRAMLAVPTISTGWLEGNLNGNGNGRTHSAPEEKRAMIDRRFGFTTKGTP